MTLDHVGMSVHISLSGLIRGENRQRCTCLARVKAERCCSLGCGYGVTCLCVRATTERRKSRTGERGGKRETKEKKQQMLRKFLDKATHVLLLKGIAEMTVKPQSSPALLSGTGMEEILEPVSVYQEGKDAQTRHHNHSFNILTDTHASQQKARLTSADGASKSEGRKWAEAAAASVRMGK